MDLPLLLFINKLLVQSGLPHTIEAQLQALGRRDLSISEAKLLQLAQILQMVDTLEFTDSELEAVAALPLESILPRPFIQSPACLAFDPAYPIQVTSLTPLASNRQAQLNNLLHNQSPRSLANSLLTLARIG